MQLGWTEEAADDLERIADYLLIQAPGRSPEDERARELVLTPLPDIVVSSQARIALFRSLFRGREDVYPRRFESRKTRRSARSIALASRRRPLLIHTATRPSLGH